jgi:hypothetical protein
VRGRASWPRNPVTCASAHAPVHGGRGEGGSDKTGPRRRERKGDARGQRLSTGEPGPRNRGRGRASGRSNWRRQVGSTKQRARQGGRARGTAADRRGLPVRRRGRAAWLGLVGRLGCFLLFFFSRFSNSFSFFLFYRVLKSKFKLGFKFKSIQTCATCHDS